MADVLSPPPSLRRATCSGPLHSKEQLAHASRREREQPQELLSPVTLLRSSSRCQPELQQPAHLPDVSFSSFGELSSLRDASSLREPTLRDAMAKRDRNFMRERAGIHPASVAADLPHVDGPSGSPAWLREWVEVQVDTRVGDAIREVDGRMRKAIRDLMDGELALRGCATASAEARRDCASALSAVERLNAELRAVVEAQERLLRVVDGISEEVVQMQDASCARVPKDFASSMSAVVANRCDASGVVDQVMRTVSDLKHAFEQELHGATGVIARLAQFEAMVAEVQRSHAEEASRNVGAIAELQHRVQGCVAAAAAPAGAAQGGLSSMQQQLACHEATLTELQRQASEGDGSEVLVQLRADVSELKEASSQNQHGRSLADEHLQNELTCLSKDLAQHKMSLADLHQLPVDMERHEVAIANLQRLELQVVRLSESEAQGQQARILDEHSARQKEDLAGLRVELRSALQEQALSMKALGEQVWVLDEQMWQMDKRVGSQIAESQTSLAPVSADLGRSSDAGLALVPEATSLRSAPTRTKESDGEELNHAICELIERPAPIDGAGSPRSIVAAGAAEEACVSGSSASEAEGRRRRFVFTEGVTTLASPSEASVADSDFGLSNRQLEDVLSRHGQERFDISDPGKGKRGVAKHMELSGLEVWISDAAEERALPGVGRLAPHDEAAESAWEDVRPGPKWDRVGRST